MRPRNSYHWKVPANLSLLTDPSAVTAAIAECDRLTRDVFLKTYGYKASRLYPLPLNGRRYDSKAIVGVAFGKQHGTPLKYSEFSGGLATVVPVLERLGFPVLETPNPAVALTPGRTYSRKELSARYGGQLQSEIWTPKEFPVVFLFSGGSGKPFGHNGGWKDQIFEYTAEGQRDHRHSAPETRRSEIIGKTARICCSS
jgi:5-methylcytosine-specific restriction protein A